MKVYSIKTYQNNRQHFTANHANLAKTETKNISDYVIKHFGLNMETMVGYKGEKTIMPPPENISPALARMINKLQIDWRTHITPKV